MDVANSAMQSPSSEAAVPRGSNPIPIGMKRSVSFNDMVAYAEAYSPTEYKREGYKNKARKRFWRFENERHDRDDGWYYCEISEEDEAGESSANHRSRDKQNREDEWDPVLAQLMRSMGPGGY